MSSDTALAEDDREPRWLSTKDAARLLGVPVRELYRLIDEGQLPAYRLGRLIRLRQAEVEAYQAGPARGPTN